MKKVTHLSRYCFFSFAIFIVLQPFILHSMKTEEPPLKEQLQCITLKKSNNKKTLFFVHLGSSGLRCFTTQIDRSSDLQIEHEIAHTTEIYTQKNIVEKKGILKEAVSPIRYISKPFFKDDTQSTVHVAVATAYNVYLFSFAVNEAVAFSHIKKITTHNTPILTIDILKNKSGIFVLSSSQYPTLKGYNVHTYTPITEKIGYHLVGAHENKLFFGAIKDIPNVFVRRLYEQWGKKRTTNLYLDCRVINYISDFDFVPDILSFNANNTVPAFELSPFSAHTQLIIDSHYTIVLAKKSPPSNTNENEFASDDEEDTSSASNSYVQWHKVQQEQGQQRRIYLVNEELPFSNWKRIETIVSNIEHIFTVSLHKDNWASSAPYVYLIADKNTLSYFFPNTTLYRSPNIEAVAQYNLKYTISAICQDEDDLLYIKDSTNSMHAIDSEQCVKTMYPPNYKKRYTTQYDINEKNVSLFKDRVVIKKIPFSTDSHVPALNEQENRSTKIHYVWADNSFYIVWFKNDSMYYGEIAHAHDANFINVTYSDELTIQKKSSDLDTYREDFEGFDGAKAQYDELKNEFTVPLIRKTKVIRAQNKRISDQTQKASQPTKPGSVSITIALPPTNKE